MNLLNAGCGTHYAEGWVNTDVWSDDLTRPDVVVVPGEPYPFEENYFDAVFMGHVLEHIHWPEVPQFLNEMSRVAKPNAPMFAIGPDVYKTIDRWKQGLEPWWMVESVLEHQDIKPEHLETSDWWDGATHHWNCHEARVKTLLESLHFPNIKVVSEEVPDGSDWQDLEISELIWPVVHKASWQFAIRFTNKG